jgi:PAS domain S-box-containing protein
MDNRLKRTTAGLVASITMAVATVFALGAYFYSNHHFKTLLDSARETALVQGELVEEALKHQMLERDRNLIREMVRGFGDRAEVESLDLLDHEGRVWFSSDPETEGVTLSRDSPACQICHQYPVAARGVSRVIESSESSILRVVIPMENREECHECHDPSESINGLVILDSDVGRMRASMNRDLRWMVGGSAVLTFLLVGIVAGILQVVLLRRLHRFETAARLIADGDLETRVPVEGSDTISWLGQEFNTMADSVTGLLREVGGQRERLETVINSIEDGIVVLDSQRRVVATNDAFMDRTGYSREEVLGYGCGDLAGCACDGADCPTVACLETGEHQVRLCQRMKEDGEVAWEEIHSSPIRLPGGEIVQVVEVWRDISERRGAEARLAESHRLASLGMLASGFSHEMNTPLATILTCIESIQREIHTGGETVPGSERIGNTATIARDQILRCKGITQHFLRLSRGEGSPGDVVEVGRMVESVLSLVDPTARRKGVAVRGEPFSGQIRVRADESDLQHALVNLLINAVEACGPEGTVLVQVEEDTSVHIRVTDNGKGIPPNEVERIFEPFISLREGGTGLGLFLALNFVRLKEPPTSPLFASSSHPFRP